MQQLTTYQKAQHITEFKGCYFFKFMFILPLRNLLLRSYFIRPEFNLSKTKVRFGLMSQNGCLVVIQFFKKAGHLPLQFFATVLCILSSLRLSGQMCCLQMPVQTGFVCLLKQLGFFLFVNASVKHTWVFNRKIGCFDSVMSLSEKPLGFTVVYVKYLYSVL